MSRAELCKSCIHRYVCMKDKNISGDVFVPGNPMIFDNEKLYENYSDWKKAGFPCGDYYAEEGRNENENDSVKNGRAILPGA